MLPFAGVWWRREGLADKCLAAYHEWWSARKEGLLEQSYCNRIPPAGKSLMCGGDLLLVPLILPDDG
jgi:hypothetical protein